MKKISFAVFWLPIIGGVLLGGFAGNAWYGGNKILAIWLAFAGIVCFLLVAAFQIQLAVQERTARSGSAPSSFRVHADTTIINPSNNPREIGPFVAVYTINGKPVMKPVRFLLHLSVTNLRNVPITVESYLLEFGNAPTDKWVSPHLATGVPIAWIENDMTKAAALDLNKCGFDDVLRNRAIQPNDHVGGWIFIYDNTVRWEPDIKIKFTETTGVTEQYVMKQPSLPQPGQASPSGGGAMMLVGTIDLSNATLFEGSGTP